MIQNRGRSDSCNGYQPKRAYLNKYYRRIDAMCSTKSIDNSLKAAVTRSGRRQARNQGYFVCILYLKYIGALWLELGM